MTRLAIALGGNALIRRGEPGSTEVQRRNLVAAARGLVTLAEGSRAEIVITHGNGPQVGFLAIGAEMAASVVPAPPLDVLGAETQGQIGYLLAQALNDAFLERGHRREIAVVVTRTVVPADDPAFANPTKPVGPIYDEATAREHAAARGWSIAPDGTNWRRVVPSPPPLRIVEAPAIRSLVDAGVLVVASGGGGVPVVERPDGRLEGVEAVIDKDFAAVVLARSVDADGLLLPHRRRRGVPALGHPSPGADPAANGRRGARGPRCRGVAVGVHGAQGPSVCGLRGRRWPLRRDRGAENAVAIVKGSSGTWFGAESVGLPRRAA